MPDTTVLCCFAAVERLDVVRDVLAGQGRWTEAVRFEVGRSARHLPALADVEPAGWLGEPVALAGDSEVLGVEHLRRAVFRGRDLNPRRHLGEAQSIYLIQHREEFSDAVWLSDDRDSLRYARGQGIEAADTMDVVRAAVALALLTPDDGFDLLRAMERGGRKLRQPVSVEELRP